MTNPLPVELVPHAYAVPETRATDAAAAASSGSSRAIGGSVASACGASSSPNRGMPSSSTIARSWAIACDTGVGV